MKLVTFLEDNKTKLNGAEKYFVENIFFNVLGEHGLDLLKPQHPFLDTSGHQRKIDFVIITSYKKYAIEIDGYSYHAEGAITREDFEDSTLRQNDIIQLGFQLMRFAWDTIRQNPVKVINQLRRCFIPDEELNVQSYLMHSETIKPYEPQQLALDAIENARNHGKTKGLISLATGLGKTYLAAFDAKRINGHTLFVVHRNEILQQAFEAFEDVWPEASKGYYHGTEKSLGNKVTFASIQTISRNEHLELFGEDYFDYIIVDETHHSTCKTYQKIIVHFKPKFFLGLTATPERMDRQDVLASYDGNLLFEVSQQEAIERGYLTPFKYFGFKDDVDYDRIYWNGFKYRVDDLNNLLIIDARDEKIIEKYKEKAAGKKAIGFCVSIEHAVNMAGKFNKAGILSEAIHSDTGLLSADERKRLTERFRSNEIKVVFAVNIFNEGVDFPDVECLLFLRPTESKTIFIQQLGRGLRICPKKEYVLVLDFIGNYKTANRIYPCLGVGSPSDLVRDPKTKEVYYFDNNGNEIHFDEEVVEIFKKLDSLSTTEVDINKITQEWKEYAEYLEKWTTDNLYWKRGQQNQYFEVQLEALNIIDENPGISEAVFIEEIQKIVNKNYPGKDMTAGWRALMLSKVSGLVTTRAPLKVTAPFKEIKRRCNDYRELATYQDILTNQLEKIYYWNSIYGTFSKYVPAEKRVSFKDFKIYPFFFIYQILLNLLDYYGEEITMSETEFNAFLAISRTHSEAEEVTERIIKYRSYNEKYELEKHLIERNKIDPRFYGILHYNKYLLQSNSGIRINTAFLDELKNRMEDFNKLMNDNSLIYFEEEDPKVYLNMLYSSDEMLSYHKKATS